MNFMLEAIKVARRSTVRTHKTGAVIVQNDEIVSNGWSHTPVWVPRGLRSLHAEMHALARGRHLDLRGATMYVACIRTKSDNIGNSRPCLHCTIALLSSGVHCIHTIPLTHTQGFAYGKMDPLLDLSELKVYERNCN